MPRTSKHQEHIKTILDFIEKSPGLRRVDLVAHLGIEPVILSALLARLAKAGHVHSEGSTRSACWFPGPGDPKAARPASKKAYVVKRAHVEKKRAATAIDLSLQQLENEERRLIADAQRIRKAINALRD